LGLFVEGGAGRLDFPCGGKRAVHGVQQAADSQPSAAVVRVQQGLAHTAQANRGRRGGVWEESRKVRKCQVFRDEIALARK
jgi:hypothetical protein